MQRRIETCWKRIRRWRIWGSARPARQRWERGLEQGGTETLEVRLVPTGVVGTWELLLTTPPGDPGEYMLTLTDSGQGSTLEVPTQGTVSLSGVKIKGTEFKAKFRQNGVRGTVSGAGSEIDGNGTPQQFVVSISLKGTMSGTLELMKNAASTTTNVNDDMLRRQVLMEIPELSKALKRGETLKAAELVLGWAARTGDFSLNGTDLARDATSVSDLYYNFLEPNVVGMSCGGYSNYYSSLLKLFDIDTLNIGFGELPILTHTTVVIPIQQDGVWNFYLMDPTFGITFRNPDTKQAATFFDLLDFQSAGRLNELSMTSINLDSRDFLSKTATSRPGMVLAGTESGNFVYHRPGYGLGTYLTEWAPLMQEAGYSTGLNGLVELIRNRVYNALIYGNPTKMNEARTAFLIEVAKREVEFGF